MSETRAMKSGTEHILIGGGIASLAAAALLIRDAGVDGKTIRVIEQAPRLGGSLDGWGNADEGFVVRGGRMFEPHFTCTFDLLDDIPSIDEPDRSVTADIRAFNREVESRADCRLVRGGKKAANRHRLELRWSDRLALASLLLSPERKLAARTIDSWFAPTFFDSNFWLLWSTMFSFAPWHSLAELRRYMRRFIHLFPGLTSLSGVLRTRYNQYDSLILPLQDWLSARGVAFLTGQAVTGIDITGDTRSRRVERIRLEDGREIRVGVDDQVYLTLGSMTDASSLGSNSRAAEARDEPGPAWHLWQDLARRQAGLGNPGAFCGDPGHTAWNSFTVTLDHPRFHAFMESFSGNATGTGGLVSFADSGWLMSIVMFHQPHFRAQPPGSHVFWGYGLRGDRPGNAVAKPMRAATGDEILAELAWHLGVGDGQSDLLAGAKVISCRMPFITSQFMPRKPGDRPPVRPDGAENFAVMGQYCELEHDCVFTVEYSVRSAWEAVRLLTGRLRPPPPVVRSDRHPPTLLRATRELLFG